MLGAGAVLIISAIEPGPDGGGVSIRDTIASIWQGQLPSTPAASGGGGAGGPFGFLRPPNRSGTVLLASQNAGASGPGEDEALIHTLNARLRAGGLPPQDPRLLRWMRLHGYYTA